MERQCETFLYFVAVAIGCGDSVSYQDTFAKALPLILSLQQYARNKELSAIAAHVLALVCGTVLHGANQNTLDSVTSVLVRSIVVDQSENDGDMNKPPPRWHVRRAAIDVAINYLARHAFRPAESRLVDAVMRAMSDTQVEVAKRAQVAFASIVNTRAANTSWLETTSQSFLQTLTTRANHSRDAQRRRRKLKRAQLKGEIVNENTATVDPNNGGGGGLEEERKQEKEEGVAVAGLCAMIWAFPYEVPPFLPNALRALSERYLSAPPLSRPHKESVVHTVNEFRRTHQDGWEEHALEFTQEQLASLNDVRVPPSYIV
jgi:hypothetical protein